MTKRAGAGMIGRMLMLPSALVVAALATPTGTYPQEDESDATAWNQFRGPGGLAVAEGQRVAPDLNLERDLKWKTTVPTGSSSPCFTEDRMFLTGAIGTRLFVLALDRETGTLLWQRSFESEGLRAYSHVDASPAMPSPCTDGAHVFVYFGAYGVIALDLEGQVTWERRLPHPEGTYGVGPSPILAAGNLIIARDGADDSAVLALDTETGEEVYRIERFAFGDSNSTPFLWRNAERDELIITSTKQLCAFDPANGEPFWKLQNITMFTCTTPTADENFLYHAGWSTPNASHRDLLVSGFPPPFELLESDYDDIRSLFDRLDADGDERVTLDELPAGRAKDAFDGMNVNGDDAYTFDEFEIFGGFIGAPGKNVALAVRAGGEGDITDTHVAWSWTRGLPYVASPLLHRDRIWLIKAGGFVTTLDAATGKRRIDRERLPIVGEYYMSPVGIGDHVLVGAASGELFVLDVKDELSITSMIEFGEPLFATPAALDGHLYVRTESTVWAF